MVLKVKVSPTFSGRQEPANISVGSGAGGVSTSFREDPGFPIQYMQLDESFYFVLAICMNTYSPVQPFMLSFFGGFLLGSGRVWAH